MMLRALPKYISSHTAAIVRDNIPHSDNRPEIKAGKLLSGHFIDVSCRFSENLKFPLNRTNAQSVHGEAFLGLTTAEILDTPSGQQHVQQISVRPRRHRWSSCN